MTGLIWANGHWKLFYTGKKGPSGWTDACRIEYFDGTHAYEQTFVDRRVFQSREEAIESLTQWIPTWIRNHGINFVDGTNRRAGQSDLSTD